MRAGETVGGRFVIGRVLGRGHMGTVYEALDQATSVVVAIKVLENEHDAAAARFAREAAVQQSLVHENIVRYVTHGKSRRALRISSWSALTAKISVRNSRVVRSSSRTPWE